MNKVIQHIMEAIVAICFVFLMGISNAEWSNVNTYIIFGSLIATIIIFGAILNRFGEYDE